MCKDIFDIQFLPLAFLCSFIRLSLSLDYESQRAGNMSTGCLNLQNRGGLDLASRGWPVKMWWVNEWMNACLDEWMDGWVNGQMGWGGLSLSMGSQVLNNSDSSLHEWLFFFPIFVLCFRVNELYFWFLFWYLIGIFWVAGGLVNSQTSFTTNTM